MASEGISTVRESVDSREHCEKQSGEFLGDRQLCASVDNWRAPRLNWSGKSSFCSKVLGFGCFLEQFATAAAGDTCNALGIKKRFDLIGLIPALGTRAATKSLSYSALNDSPFYVTGHVGPGSLSVASGLFEATGCCVARLFAADRPGDAYNFVQLDCPDELHYIGLKSNTECPVSNPVGASIVREHQSLWKESEGSMVLTELEHIKLNHDRTDINKGVEVEGGQNFGRLVGRDARREVKVIILNVGIATELEAWRGKDILVSLKASKGATLLLGWLPLGLTIGEIAICYICKQWFVAGLILLGTLGMMVAVFGLRLCVLKYSKPKVANAAPEGDCLVLDETDADTMHLVMGEEECIQALFQRKIDYQPSLGKYVMFVAGCMLYIYFVASALYMPNVSTSGQIHFAIANIIGLVTDMCKASRNGKLGLAKKACEQFKIVVRDLVVFRNRTAAVAYVAKHTKDRTMLKSKKLLPCDGPVWQKWWEVLAKYDGKSGDISTKSVVTELDDEKDQRLLRTLLEDMIDGLEA